MRAFLIFLVVLLIAVVLYLLWLLFGGNKDRFEDPNDKLNNYVAGEYILKVKPGVTDARIKEFIGKDDIQIERCDCDTLILVRGLDADMRIVGVEGDVALKPPGRAAGDSIVTASRNFRLKLFPQKVTFNADSFRREMAPVFNSRPSDSGPSLTIAVFDSGLDTTLIPTTNPYIWKNDPTDDPNACYNDARFGWNFVNGNASPYDDDDRKHGTIVTSLILKEAAGRNVRVMPLKVLNSNNEGTLYSLLCATKFAQRHGARILNMSLGGYAADISYPLYERVLDELERDGQTMIVAAAGNADDSLDAIEKLSYDPSLSDEKKNELVRNLSHRDTKFFPAVYSARYQNIITVTTVIDNKEAVNVCPRQNHSATYVNVGVFNPNRSDCSLMAGGISLTGSSFAAPVVSGKLAKWLLSNPAANNNREPVLSQVPAEPRLVRNRVQKQRVWVRDLVSPSPITAQAPTID